MTTAHISFESIPTTEPAAGDYHELVAAAVTPQLGVRGAEVFFRAPANQSLALGPPLADPIVLVVSSTPYVRMRTQLTGQFDYSTVVVVQFKQQTQFSVTDIAMTV